MISNWDRKVVAEVIDQALALANDHEQLSDPSLRLTAVQGWLQGARVRLLGAAIAIKDLPPAIQVLPPAIKHQVVD